MIDVTKPRKQPLPAPPSDDAPEADHIAHAERWLRHSGRLDPGMGLGDFTGTVVAWSLSPEGPVATVANEAWGLKCSGTVEYKWSKQRNGEYVMNPPTWLDFAWVVNQLVCDLGVARAERGLR